MSDDIRFDVSGAIDPEVEAGTANNEELYLTFSGAKVKLNSIDELVKVVNTINNKLDQEDAENTRLWVHLITKTHPLVDDEIKDLTYFKPVSEEIGSTYLLHTSDTQSLALEDWTGDKPLALRNLLKEKVSDETYDSVNSSYQQLNQAMANNISTEFYNEQKNVNNNYLDKNIYSNDYHIAGDYSFEQNHLRVMNDALMAALINYMGNAKKLINWLEPVNSSTTSYSGGVTISVEGNDVVVNLKGDKLGVFATVIDESSISDLECAQ